jgi:hypothetical protein
LRSASIVRTLRFAAISLAPLLLAVALFASPQASDLSASQSKLLALENAWGQAEEHGDAKTLDSLLDDGLVYIRYDGTLWTKSQYLASLKDRTSHEDQGVSESMNAHVYGQSAVVTGIYRVKGVEKGKPYSRRERFADVWVSQDGAWVCVSSQVTLIGR